MKSNEGLKEAIFFSKELKNVLEGLDASNFEDIVRFFDNYVIKRRHIDYQKRV